MVGWSLLVVCLVLQAANLANGKLPWCQLSYTNACRLFLVVGMSCTATKYAGEKLMTWYLSALVRCVYEMGSVVLVLNHLEVVSSPTHCQCLPFEMSQTSA
jgi:hypothetical protein